MTTTAHKLLDHLLDDLKKELCAKMQQDIVLELEKKQRDLQNMVADMLAEHREEMVELLMNKVHQEIKQEFEMYAEATNAQCADSEVRNAFERTPYVVVLKFHVFIHISKSFNFRCALERILRYLTKT